MVASTAQIEPPAVCVAIPRGERRRREIAAVAEHVFFELGFADTTMQEIAARAGASKETLYRHFGSKEGLFAELVECRARGFLARLDENFETPGSVDDVLRSVGTSMLDTLLRTDVVALCRLVITESQRNPDLGKIFLASGPDRVRHRLAAFLSAAKSRGEIGCEDCDLAARVFLGAVVGAYHLPRMVLPEMPYLTNEQRDAHVDEVVRMFIQRYARG